MESIKVVIVEDEFVIAEDLRSKLEEHGYEVTAVFDNAEKAIPFILHSSPEILLVDIFLHGQKDGVELVTQLQSHLQLPVVYVTANSDPATYDRAKLTKPSAFLVKPFSEANLLATLDLALLNFSSNIAAEKIERPIEPPEPANVVINQYLFVKLNNRYKKIHCEDILFAEAAGSYIHIQTTDQRYVLSQNLAQFQKKTPLPNFLRIHRSYIINLSKVDSFEESFVFIENHKLPLSENHRHEFLSRVHCL